jgi:hypothetical protein
MMDEGVGDLLPLDHDGMAAPGLPVDQSGLLEQPAVDRIEEQLRPSGDLDDLELRVVTVSGPPRSWTRSRCQALSARPTGVVGSMARAPSVLTAFRSVVSPCS